MSDARKIAGTPVDKNFGGKDLKFKPFGIWIMEGIEAWVSGRQLKTILSSIPLDGTPENSQERREVMREFSITPITDYEYIMQEPTGIIHSLYLSCSYCDPQITKDEFQALFEAESKETIQALVSELTNVGARPDVKKKEEEKN